MINTDGRHPGTAGLARFFDADHLSREDMRTVSQACCDLAATMIEKLDDGPELSAGLRKLLEAKDCFVRAVL